MKSLSIGFGIILTVILVFYAYNSFAEISVNYDRFKDKTMIQTDPKKTKGIVSQPALVLMGFYDGQTPSRPALCSIGFVVISPKGWAYLQCHSVDFLADGKQVKLPTFKHAGNTGEGGKVLEFINADVPFIIVEQLSNSKKVEFKLCNTEFSLSKNEMEDLKTFVEAFRKKK